MLSGTVVPSTMRILLICQMFSGLSSASKCQYRSVLGSVSDSGSEGLWFSLDGNEWYQSNITDFKIKKLLCGDNICLALTDGSIYYSNDGMYWKQSNIEYGKYLEFNNTENIYIAGSIDDKGFYYSNNGKKWQHSNITSGNVKTIVCGEDKSIIFTEDGTVWYSNT